MKIERPRGTRDFSTEEMEERDRVESTIAGVFRSYGYKKVRTPTFEHMDLFTLKSGDEISTHMYAFEDKKGRKMCLRPEETASICRMFSESLRMRAKPLKLYYYDPMFRYEEPQKGRYREFWQMGMELIGPKGPESDAEVISVAYDSLKELGCSFRLEIGHLGIVKGLLADKNIGEDVQRKAIACIDKNDAEGLRKLTDEQLLFDLISLKGGKEVIAKAEEKLKDSIKAIAALTELKQILEYLDVMGLEYTLNLGVARGLEFYTGMVFEIRVPDLGAQSQICGGGRYDNLIELFSGISVPAVGFAFGFDRVTEALQMQGADRQGKKAEVIVAPASPDMKKEALKIASDLRRTHVVEYDLMDRKLGKILEYAGEKGTSYVVIVGKKDHSEGMVTIRDMSSGEQKTVKIEEAGEALK
jgi:histidyl-tRNA synthetase